MCGKGRKRTVTMTQRAVPVGFHTSQMVLHVIHRVSDVHKFSYNNFVTGEDE